MWCCQAQGGRTQGLGRAGGGGRQKGRGPTIAAYSTAGTFDRLAALLGACLPLHSLILLLLQAAFEAERQRATKAESELAAAQTAIAEERSRGVQALEVQVRSQPDWYDSDLFMPVLFGTGSIRF